MQKQKAFDLILRLAIESSRYKQAVNNDIKILEAIGKHLTPEQIQIALEQYPIKEI